MNQAQLEQRLRELAPPDLEGSLERATKAIAVSQTAPAPSGRLHVSGRAGLGIVIAALAILSPPGQAVADKLGELIGIGDEPTIEDRSGAETDAVIVGVAEAPGGDRVELVAFRVDAKVGQKESVARTCFGYDLADAERSSGTCLDDAPGTPITAHVEAAPSVLYPESQFVVQGVTSPGVARLEITHEARDGGREPLDVKFGKLSSELAIDVGSEFEAGTFAAFLPPLVDEVILMSEADVATVISGVKIDAYDSAGELLDSETLDPSDQDSQIPVPTITSGQGFSFDIPIPDGTYPPGDGITFGGSVQDVPAPYASLSGPPDAERVSECEKAFSTGIDRFGPLDSNGVEFCAITLAHSAGFLHAGRYSKKELAAAIESSGVVPPEYSLPFQDR